MRWKEKLGTDSPESVVEVFVVEDFVVFPILANIYLHNLDVEISQIAKKYHKGKTRRKILGAVSVECRKYQKKEFKMFLPEKQVTILSTHKADKCKLGTTFTDWSDLNFLGRACMVKSVLGM
jgi:hypothetical protein